MFPGLPQETFPMVYYGLKAQGFRFLQVPDLHKNQASYLMGLIYLFSPRLSYSSLFAICSGPLTGL
jgi:hypothetical protein